MPIKEELLPFVVIASELVNTIHRSDRTRLISKEQISGENSVAVRLRIGDVKVDTIEVTHEVVAGKNVWVVDHKELVSTGVSTSELVTTEFMVCADKADAAKYFRIYCGTTRNTYVEKAKVTIQQYGVEGAQNMFAITLALSSL